MRVLVLSFYFEPDLSAGSFRASALVNALGEKIGQEGGVDVITTQPNRYHSFSSGAPQLEERTNGVSILRVALPLHRGGFLDQARAYLVYAFRVLWHLRGKRYDVVFATSSRLMTAVLGAMVSQWKGIPLYLDVRDIFVDTIQDVLPRPIVSVLKPIFRMLEKYAMNQAKRINLVSEGFRDYFDSSYPDKSYGFIPNGIDEEFLGINFSVEVAAGARKRKIVLYAGNIGEGQGLHRIVPALASHFVSTYEFWVVGDGGLRRELERSVAGLDNVKIIPPVSRNDLIEFYRQSDILFLHLNDYQAFRKVLPSKVFEYAATGKPILAGVSGYAADFIGGQQNVAVFPPCDAVAGAMALQSLKLGVIPREIFVERYRRATLMKDLSSDLLGVAQR